MSLAFAQPTEWWLEIPSEIKTRCWHESGTLATPTRRQQVYLNQLCLQVFLPWFQQNYAPALSWPDNLPSIWEFMDGSGLTVGAKRLVILPVDTAIPDGIDVPQAWVDMPNWAADYYLAIQIDLDQNWLRVWGYTTHQSLKKDADYDPCDRTYSLAAQNLQRDFNAFWSICQLCPNADTQTVVAPLPAPSIPQAHQAMEYLIQTDDVFPRLTLSFEQWGALLNDANWRQQFYQRRLASVRAKLETPRTKTELSQWLKKQFTDAWQPLESWLGSEQLALAYNLRRVEQVKGFCAPRIKFITLNADVAPQQVALLMVLNSELDDRMGIRVQVHPAIADHHVPTGLSLAIYSQDNEILQCVQAHQQEDYIRLPHFKCLPGTQFRLQITLRDATFSELFSV